MPSLVLFAPNRADGQAQTAALASTRWIAEQTRSHVEPAWRLDLLLDDQATRSELERAMTRNRDAYVFFTHGRRDANPGYSMDALLGQGAEPALDRDNIERFEADWVHAMACRSADEIPRAIQDSLVALVVSTTRLLMRGCRSEKDLQRAAQRHADEILEWFGENDDAPAHWALFAEQLARVRLLSAGGGGRCCGACGA